MNDIDEIWLISGGEPGAERFGQLVQYLRKEMGYSVDRLAADTALSVGGIRAIEQGRRAPSEESGIRILRVLLPEGALMKGRDDTERRGLDYSFKDPRSGLRILLEFGAKTAGDNRRWSIDKATVAESRSEAIVRELMSDPKRLSAWRDEMRPALTAVTAAIEEIEASALRPAGDLSFGRTVRRLAGVDAIRLERLTNLLNLWDYASSADADEDVKEHASKVNMLIDSMQIFPEGIDADGDR
jgi:transcriptional regulator with XRE-family HTH domain